MTGNSDKRKYNYLQKKMTCIKCCRKVAKVFAIFVIVYTRKIIKEREEITFKPLQYTFYYLWGLTCPCMNYTSNINL